MSPIHKNAHSSPWILSLTVLALAAASRAQTSVVIPANAATTDGNSIRRAAGFDDAVHQQLLIAPWHLSGCGGQLLTSLALRRDVSSDLDAFAGGDVELDIWLSSASTDVAQPSPTFAANRGPDHTLVFSGVVTLPAMPQVPPGTTAPAPFAVDVSFTTPFLYLPATTLLVELEGRPVATTGSEWWPVDAAASLVAGTANPVGSACGVTGRSAHTAWAVERDLVPGKVARLGFRGDPSTPATMMVSLASVENLLPLPLFGAGCALHVVPPFVAEIPVMTGDSEVWPGLGAQASFDLPLPGDPAILGLAFSVQWIQIGAGRVHFSNALDIEVASQLPDLGMALVEAVATDPAGQNFPAVGTVDTTTGLVVKIGHN
jgi:hypothetical protein